MKIPAKIRLRPIGWTGCFFWILAAFAPPLHGQSFLSESVPAWMEPIAADPAEIGSEETAAMESIPLPVEESGRTDERTLLAPKMLLVPMEESGRTDESLPAGNGESGEGEPEPTQSLTLRALAEAERTVRDGRPHLALLILGQLPKEPESSLSEDRKFAVLELRQYLLIRIRYLLSDFERVVEYSRIYLQNYGNGDNFYRVYYYFASALNRLGKPLEFTSLVTEEMFDGLPEEERSRLREVLIEDAIANREIAAAFFYLEEADGGTQKKGSVWAERAIEELEDPADVDEILSLYGNGRYGPQLRLKKIGLLIRDGNHEEARQYLDSLSADESAAGKYRNDLEELREFLVAARNTDPYKIGVLLPFSHRIYWTYAQQALDGLELALRELNADLLPIRLVLKDSAVRYAKSQSAAARKLEVRKQIDAKVEELVEQDQVIAILGPLTKAASVAAGRSADRLKVPVISFSQTEDIGRDLPFLFRFFRRRTQEAETIAHYATDYLNAGRFVLFYTAKGKGLEVVDSFETVVESKGGRIVGSIPIRSGQVDFQEGMRSVTGGLRILSEKEKLELKQSGERFQADLDFDAVFFSGSPESLRSIVSFLHLYGAGHAWILTGSGINIRENQLLKYTRKLRFVDAFPLGGSSASMLRPLQERHWKYYNHRRDYAPPTAYTIFAYEALELLGKLLLDPRHRNRRLLADAIRALQGFSLKTGTVSFYETGDLVKDLKILRIRHRETVDAFKVDPR